MYLILGIAIIIFIYFYFRKGNMWAENKKLTQIIDENEARAFDNKDKLKEYLKKERKLRANQLKGAIKRTGIKEPKTQKSLTLVKKKLGKKDERAKKLFERMDKVSELELVGILYFEEQYIRLKEKFKFDFEELVKISTDYCDWYYNQQRLWDPLNYELWNTSSWDDEREAYIKIQEIEKRLKKKANEGRNEQ